MCNACGRGGGPYLGVAADPEKVDLAELHNGARVDHAVPDRLEHRRERRDTDAGTDQDGHLYVRRHTEDGHIAMEEKTRGGASWGAFNAPQS